MRDSAGIKYIDSEFYRAYYVCKRLVWLAWHAADGILENPWQNDSVVSIAKGLFPAAVDILEHCSCLEEALDESKRVLRAGKVLVNGRFASSIGVADADIIVPLTGDYKELIMICSTHGIHPLFVEKIAFTAAVLIKNGIEPGKISLLKVNPDYTRRGRFEPRQFFTKKVITGRIASRMQDVEEIVSEIYKIIKLSNPPEQIYDKHCHSPLVCPFYENCWRMVPEKNIFSLYRGGKKIKRLMESGILDLTKVTDEVELSERQRIQVIAAKTGEPYVNKKKIKQFLNKLNYPLHFLDFETISLPLPIFENTKPFETVPYEFSLNIQEEPCGAVKTVNYLAEADDDPRPEILKILSREIRPEGSVVAYNAAFERTCLEQCVKVCPEYSTWLEGVIKRLVDLLKPFKSLDYYHPHQRGSASLKAILPCLTGVSYDRLAIKNGDMAAEHYLKLVSGSFSDVEKTIIRRQLEEYCYTDSIGMLWIIDALRKLSY